MAAALCAGVTQLIIPFSVDQPANRLYRLGWTMKPLRKKALTADDLSNALIDMDSSDIQERWE